MEENEEEIHQSNTFANTEIPVHDYIGNMAQAVQFPHASGQVPLMPIVPASPTNQIMPHPGTIQYGYPDAHHQSSSVYHAAVSSLIQSPSGCSRVVDPMLDNPLQPSPAAIGFASPPFHTTANLTSLEPVTPSRIYQSPMTICEQIGQTAPGQVVKPAVTSDQGFKSPPHPFRLHAPDGTEFRPIIKKTGNGRITITYPLDMLANTSLLMGAPGQNLPIKVPQTVMTPRNSFTQFLNFPSLSDGKKTPAPQSDDSTPQTETSIATPVRPSVAETSSAKEIAQPEVTPQAISEENDEKENEDEEEERQTVQTITKALNIECDVYKETKKKAKQEGHVRLKMRNKLPKEVQGLMGEANLCFARGEHDDAIKMCMEIVRIAPYCPDPFETLAMIYEERGEKVKSLQYSLLAAHLQPADVETWIRLADTCEEVGFLLQAVHCYNKASKLKPNDYKLCWAAAVLQQQLGNLRQALILFKSVVNLLPETEVIQCMALARDIARTCHANDETQLAMEVMEEVATKHFDHVKYEDVNVMCELALSARQYKKVFDIMVKHCRLKVQYESADGSEEVLDFPSDSELQLAYVEVPEHTPVDLQCKCILASIHLGCFDQVLQLFEDFCSMSPADIGDLQFDIVEVLMEVKEYRRALYVLDILVSSPDYSMAAVWLEKGTCHRHLEEYAEETECFKEVIQLAPGHTKAYLALCAALRKLGKFREANEVIEEAETYEIEGEEQMLLNYERFKTYKENASVNKKRHEKLCKAADAALLMLANKMEAAFIPAKTILVKRSKRSGKKYMGDMQLSRRIGKNYYKYHNKKSLCAKGSESALSSDEWWDLNKKTIDLLLETERYSDGIILADAALFYAPWYNNLDKRLVLERIAVTLCIIGGNFSLAYTFIKTWLLQPSKTTQLWNLFNQITRRSQDQRHHRFCLRSLVKEPESIALAVLNGHNSLATGTYKHSLGEYMRAHKKIPTEPMFMLLLGVVYTHIASQKFTSHKNSLVVQGLAFLNQYREHRKCDQEACYNIGRALHQLGLVHFAVHWYHRALDVPPVTHPELDEEVLDLTHEIAYNLALIYKKSGNVAAANQLIEEYCVI